MEVPVQTQAPLPNAPSPTDQTLVACSNLGGGASVHATIVGSRSAELLISHGPRAVARAAAVFGPGALVHHLRVLPPDHPQERGEEQRVTDGGGGGRLQQRRHQEEAEAEAGAEAQGEAELSPVAPLPLCPGEVAAEAIWTTAALDAHLTALDEPGLAFEVRRLRSWTSGASARVRLLERRAAWALLGLGHEGADAAEVRRAYKRRALALHPDKGGDARRFQLLQELSELVAPKAGEVEGDGDITGEARGGRAKQAEKETGLKPDSDREMRDDGGNDNDRARLERERRNLQREAAELWERCEALAAELDTTPAAASVVAEATRVLRVFAQQVMPVELSLLSPGDVHGASLALDRFLRDGGELLTTASALDPLAAMGIVATEVTGPLSTLAADQAFGVRCTALLNAVQNTPRLLEEMLCPSPDSQAEEVRGWSSSVEAAMEGAELAQVVPACDSVVTADVLMTSWRAGDQHECAGQRRSDGSAVYCTACDCWVQLRRPFDFCTFQEHCETDFMHEMAAGSLG